MFPPRYTWRGEVYNDGLESPEMIAQTVLFKCIYRNAADLQFSVIDNTSAYLGDRQKNISAFILITCRGQMTY